MDTLKEAKKLEDYYIPYFPLSYFSCCFMNQVKLDRAAKLYCEAAHTFLTINNQKEAKDAYISAAKIYEKIGEPECAAIYYEAAGRCVIDDVNLFIKSADIYLSLNKVRRAITIYCVVVDIFKSQKDIQQSLFYMEKIINITSDYFSQNGNYILKNIFLSRLSEYYIILEKYYQAHKIYEKLFFATGNRNIFNKALLTLILSLLKKSINPDKKLNKTYFKYNETCTNNTLAKKGLHTGNFINHILENFPDSVELHLINIIRKFPGMFFG